MNDEERRREAADKAVGMGFRPGLDTIVELEDGKWSVLSEGGRVYLFVKGSKLVKAGAR